MGDGHGYMPAGLFQRTDAERADQFLSWQRDDRAFFAAGACHILAWAFMRLHPDSGFEVYALRRPGSRYSSHVYVSDGTWAFDYFGWTPDAELRQAYQMEVSVVSVGLETFCAENWHRLPEQYPHMPWDRAYAYIGGFPRSHAVEVEDQSE